MYRQTPKSASARSRQSQGPAEPSGNELVIFELNQY